MNGRTRVETSGGRSFREDAVVRKRLAAAVLVSVCAASLLAVSFGADRAWGFTLLAQDDLAVGCPSLLDAGTPLTLTEDVPQEEKGSGTASQESGPPPAGVYAVESPFSVEFPKLLVRDAVHVLTSPLRWDESDWLIFGGVAAGVAALSLADRPVNDERLRLQNGSARDVSEEIRKFGGVYSFGALGLFYAGGEVFHDPTAKAVFVDGAAATLVTSAIITPSLKFIVGRARPRADKGAYHFDFFSVNNSSFPSGETGQAFTVASVVASHYDDLAVKIASYGIAGLVGMSRMYEDAHWLSDAAAGAAIGTAVGVAIVRFNEKRRANPDKKTDWFVAPFFARGSGGLALTLVR